MKAYGLALLIQRTVGATTDITTTGPDPEAEANQIRICSRLDAAQIQKLEMQVKNEGWELYYSGWFLAAVPSKSVHSVPEAPGVTNSP